LFLLGSDFPNFSLVELRYGKYGQIPTSVTESNAAYRDKKGKVCAKLNKESYFLKISFKKGML